MEQAGSLRYFLTDMEVEGFLSGGLINYLMIINPC
jgi:hypothetical protein